MRYSELPGHIQAAISQNQVQYRHPHELSPVQIERLDQLSPEELFEAFCDWQGFLSWGRTLRETWEIIKGPDPRVVEALQVAKQSLADIINAADCGSPFTAEGLIREFTPDYGKIRGTLIYYKGGEEE